MIFQDNNILNFEQSLESGLYFVIIGYYFLLFAFFLLMRFRLTKKEYWLFFSLLFLCFAFARVFFIFNDFFLLQFKDFIDGTINRSLAYLPGLLWKLATFFSWLGISCLMGILGILLFTEKDKKSLILRAILVIGPIIIGITALILPEGYFLTQDTITEYGLTVDSVFFTIGSWQYPMGRFIFTLILSPIFTFVIPFLFLYLAIRTFGVLRRSYLLNSIGFLIYYTGRILQGALQFTTLSSMTQALIPPFIILLALLLIVIANNYEQLR